MNRTARSLQAAINDIATLLNDSPRNIAKLAPSDLEDDVSRFNFAQGELQDCLNDLLAARKKLVNLEMYKEESFGTQATYD